MRLEFESSPSTLSFNEIEIFGNFGGDVSSAQASLHSGIKAARAGNLNEARQMLLSAAEIEPHSESVWLCLASISEYPEELLFFLGNVLEINPTNERALELMKETKAKLAANFLQRGIDAVESCRNDFARQSFYQAAAYDARNESAWLWLAFSSNSAEEKRTFLDKVLNINPKNEAAQKALDEINGETAQTLLLKAVAVYADDRTAANELLAEALRISPRLTDAWLLKSHLSDNFAEKIKCYEKILEFDHAHEAAIAGLSSLKAFMKNVAVSTESSTTEKEETKAEPNFFHSEELHEEKTKPDLSLEENDWSVLEDDTFADEDIRAEQFSPAEEDLSNESETVANEADQKAFFELESYSEENFIADNDAVSIIGETEQWENNSSENNFYKEENMLELENNHTENKHSNELNLTDEVFLEESDLMEIENFAGEAEENEFSSESTLKISPRFQLEFFDCPFCAFENDVQAFACQNCRAVLSLSDLEMLLGNQNSDAEMLSCAVERMEADTDVISLSENELLYLGIGHINLKNFRRGFSYLQQASQANPNDVLLSSQVNALAIRLEEIERQEEAHDSQLKGRKILVVDDSPTVRKLISGKLEKSGHEVVCAVDGMDALAKLNEIEPDLILLDITMPRMDGYQVCKLIRSNPLTKEIPVVMISGKDGFFDKVRGRMAGTTGYITKPFGPETLMKALDVYIKNDGENVFSDEEFPVSIEA
ncbi:MAG TPA: response regulator [Pyrinomonadaceae bacterium]|jgi:twitching motility two-component system response regulator PilG